MEAEEAAAEVGLVEHGLEFVSKVQLFDEQQCGACLPRIVTWRRAASFAHVTPESVFANLQLLLARTVDACAARGGLMSVAAGAARVCEGRGGTAPPPALHPHLVRAPPLPREPQTTSAQLLLQPIAASEKNGEMIQTNP